MHTEFSKGKQEYSDRLKRPVVSCAERPGKIELFLTRKERDEIARRNPRPHNLARFVREVIAMEFGGMLPAITKVREPENEARHGVVVRMPKKTVEEVHMLAKLRGMSASDYLVNRLLTCPSIERPEGVTAPANRNRRILDQSGRKEVAVVRIAKALAALARCVERWLASGERDRAQKNIERMTRAVDSIKDQERHTCT